MLSSGLFGTYPFVFLHCDAVTFKFFLFLSHPPLWCNAFLDNSHYVFQDHEMIFFSCFITFSPVWYHDLNYLFASLMGMPSHSSVLIQISQHAGWWCISCVCECVWECERGRLNEYSRFMCRCEKIIDFFFFETPYATKVQPTCLIWQLFIFQRVPHECI